MEQIKIDFEIFQELKAAIWDKDYATAAKMIENIEFDHLKKTILRITYKNYKTTGNEEFLKEYINIKNSFD